MPLTRICRISWKEFTITEEEITLLDKLAPVIGGEKFEIPLPTLCPEERRRRRLVFKNYFSLFKRKDVVDGKGIISIFPPESPYPVCSQERWWGDSWSPLDFGQEYDPGLPIFTQIGQIREKTPVPALDNAYLLLENSEYINGNGASKDCYLVSNGANNEKCLYGWFIFKSTNILDANYITECENCSYSQHLWKCYDVHYSWDTSESRNSRYIFSCEWCQYILGCVGLRNQKYQILNTPCTKEEFEDTLKKIKYDSVFRKSFEMKLQDLINTVGLEKFALTGSVDSTGDFCYDSKNAYECYSVGDCDNVAHITDAFDVKDTMDFNQWGDRTSLCYECSDCGENISNIYWSNSVWWWAKYNFYSTKCIGCSYIFGCSGLKNQSYCIFNKQYPKDEWENVAKQIIRQMQKEGTWWNYLDPIYSPFAYNESHAMEKLPLSREEAVERWFRWSDREDIPPDGITKIILGDRLPDTIETVPDDVLRWAIQCTQTGKLFQIQPVELDMLRRFGIPLPCLHPMERIQRLFSWDKRVFHFDF